MARCNHHGRVPQDRASLSGNVCLSVACMHSSASASLCLAGTHPLCWLISRKRDVGSPSSTITKALEHVHSHVSCFTAAELCLLPLIPSLEFIMPKKRSTALLSGGHFPYWDCVLAKNPLQNSLIQPFSFSLGEFSVATMQVEACFKTMNTQCTRGSSLRSFPLKDRKTKGNKSFLLLRAVMHAGIIRPLMIARGRKRCARLIKENKSGGFSHILWRIDWLDICDSRGGGQLCRKPAATHRYFLFLLTSKANFDFEFSLSGHLYN